METREIDARLQRYTASEHRIGSNLQELEQHSVYQLLTTDVLTGETAKALAPLSSCLLYTSPSPRDATLSRMPSSA